MRSKVQDNLHSIRGFVFNLLNFLCGRPKKNKERKKKTKVQKPKEIKYINEDLFISALKVSLNRPSINQINGSVARQIIFGLKKWFFL